MAASGRKNADSALLAALAAGKTVADAAVTAGIAERTAYRRLTDTDFRRRVAELRAAMVGRAVGKMVDAMTEAADTLWKLLNAEGESTRLGAARSILNWGTSYVTAWNWKSAWPRWNNASTTRPNNEPCAETPS